MITKFNLTTGSSIFLICFYVFSASAGHLLRRHPDNPAIFEFRGKPTVCIGSGEHYGAVLNSEFDYMEYLDQLHKEGHNHTRIFTGYYVEEWNPYTSFTGEAKTFFPTNPVNNLNPAPGKLIAPWARTDVPGNIDGGNKFDLTKWDPAYWERLKHFLTEAGKREIIVEICLFSAIYEAREWQHCPAYHQNNINNLTAFEYTHKPGDWNSKNSPYHPFKADHIAVQEAMVRKFAQELKDFDNIYFEICNEYYYDAQLSWHDRMAQVFRDAQKDFPQKHLLSINTHLALDFKREIRTELYDIINIHYLHASLEKDSRRLMETGLMWGSNENEGDPLVRYEPWQMVLAGGAICNNLDWYYTVQDPRGLNWLPLDISNKGKGNMSDRLTMQYVRKYLDKFNFVKMRPMTGKITNVPQYCKGWMMGEPGRAYILYIHPWTQPGQEWPWLADFEREYKATPVLADIPAGSYIVEWLNPRNGEIIGTEEKDHSGGNMTLTTPTYKGDIAFSVRAKDYPYKEGNISSVLKQNHAHSREQRNIRRVVILHSRGTGALNFLMNNKRIYSLNGERFMSTTKNVREVFVIVDK